MGRTLNAGMATAVAAAEGYADVWLLSLTSSGGTTLLTTAQQNVLYSGDTYTAAGGALELAPPAETFDPAAQSMQMTLSGVTQTIVSDLLSNNMRGQGCTVYFGQVLLSTGVLADAPIQVFTGYLNEQWRVTEQVGRGLEPGTVTVSTTVTSDIARYLFARGCRTNVTSHNDMLDRGGITTGDTLFKRVPELVGKLVVWGRKRQVLGGNSGVEGTQGGDPDGGESDGGEVL